MADEEQQPSVDELLDQIRKLKIADVLLSTFSTVGQLAYAKLDEGSRDLPDARLAIDSLSALLPVLEGSVPDEALRDYRSLVDNLKLAYAEAASG